jgi:L-2-hydroxyglutarate oxidase LhgO
MTKFCIENQISHHICGKILVASNSRKELFLDNFAERLAKIA